MLPNLKHFVEEYADELFLVAVIVFVGLISFSVGRLSGTGAQQGELRVESTPLGADALRSAVTAPNEWTQGMLADGEEGDIVGNKNSKIYHRPDCSGARRMAEGNKVFFASPQDAKNAGYRAAANCPGLE